MRMSRVSVILILMFFAAALSISRSRAGYGPDVRKEGASFKVVGYLSGRNFPRIDELELNRLTHLNLAFANPDKDGKLVFSRGLDIAPVVNKGHAAGLKVFVSLAGGGRTRRSGNRSVAGKQVFLRTANRGLRREELPRRRGRGHRV